MESSRSVSIRNVAFIIYALAFFGLTSIAILDVKTIIIDYIENNRFTSVKSRNTTLDYYQYVPAPRVCLYDVPPDPDFASIDENDYWTMMNNSLHHEEITWKQNGSSEEKSVASDIFQLRLIKMISNLDKQGLQANVVTNQQDMATNYGMSSEAFKILFENFIEDPKSLVSAKRAWETAKEIMVHKVYPVAAAQPIELGPDDALMCLSLPLADDLVVSWKENNDINLVDKMYIINSRYTENEDDINSDNEGVSSIELYMSGQILDIRKGDKKKTAVTKVAIASNGIFNSTLFPPCTNDFETESDCLQDLKSRTMAEVCQCIQFSVAWRNNFSERSNSSQPFCTIQHYEKCWDEAVNETNRRQDDARSTGVCKPCVILKNSYTLTFDINTEELFTDYRPWYPSAKVTFSCQDSTYLIFEEKPQFSLSQLISQVGGDLGLYIGFSMISFLELILFLYQMRQRRRESANDEGASLRGSSNWIKFYMRYFLRSITEESTESPDLALVIRQEMREQLGALRNEMKRELVREISQLEQRLCAKLDAENRSVFSTSPRIMAIERF